MPPRKKVHADALKPSKNQEVDTDEVDLEDVQKTIQSNNTFCVFLTIHL